MAHSNTHKNRSQSDNSNYKRQSSDNKNYNKNNKGNTNYQNNSNKNNYSPEIYAPFNFVPVPEIEKKVFHPEWSAKISHDIPFETGLNGILQVTIKSITPIFTKDSSISSEESVFCRFPDGTFFIPATTMKGCIRNVLEIMSFGKMTAVSNKKFETKDFRDNDLLTIHTVIPDCMLNKKDGKNFEPDLAESIFGYTTKTESLKGRVQFSHAVAIAGTASEENKVKSFEAYSPHPSYYPFYSKDGKKWFLNNDEEKWSNKNSCIAGWKRYLIQKVANNTIENKKNNNSEKDHKTATVRFLKAGAQFSLTIRFQNLLPVELGALLAALTFIGQNDKCFHNVGFGKPYGYGKIQISNPVLKIIDYDSNSVNIHEDYISFLEIFKTEMNNFVSKWENRPQIKELIAIAKGWNKNVGYMSLPEYRQGKNKNLKLKRFSKLVSEYVASAGYTPVDRQQNQISNQSHISKNKDLDTNNNSKSIANADKEKKEKKNNIENLSKPAEKKSDNTTRVDKNTDTSTKTTQINLSKEYTGKYLGDNKVKIAGVDYGPTPILYGGKLNLETLIGKDIVVKIIEYNKKKNRINKVSFLRIKE